MAEEILIGLALILVLGVGAQLLAWHMRLPSILLLLIFGFIAGPVTGIVDPDDIFGELLLPFVSVSVAIILFEGGLSLQLRELKATGLVVQRLITAGALATWGFSSLLANALLGLEWPIAILLGGILVVSGPTVVGPLIRHIKPSGTVASVLRWEGILIDPIGALLSVLIYEAILAGELGDFTGIAMVGLWNTLLTGGLIGLLGAGILVVLMSRFLIPDFLQSPVTLMVVISAFIAANHLQAEAGLMAVTLMGIALANQRRVPVKHIIAFKENLTVLLISGLFIMLAARLNVEDMGYLNIESVVFLAMLIFIVRPLSVFLSTINTDLTVNERLFLSFIYPRGIVAAAMASLFAIGLAEAGFTQALVIVPYTFIVIVGTVIVYGIGGPYIARALGVSDPNPQGVVIVGAQSWSVTIAQALTEEGYRVQLVDTNWSNVTAARMSGIPTHYLDILSEASTHDINMEGVGGLLALTPNDGINSIATLRFSEYLDRSSIYQLYSQVGGRGAKSRDKDAQPIAYSGRGLFGPEVNFSYLADRFDRGDIIKKTKITAEFDFQAFRKIYGDDALPLFIITESGRLMICSAGDRRRPKAGQTVLALVRPVDDTTVAPVASSDERISSAGVLDEREEPSN